MKLIRLYHFVNGDEIRSDFISRIPSYHGSTLGALALTAYQPLNEPFSPLIQLYPKVKSPTQYRIPDEMTKEEYALVCANEIEDAILERTDIVFDVFSKISVKDAEAGNPEDQANILGEVERTVGFTRLNATAFEQMRSWIFGVCRKIADEAEGVDNLWKKAQIANLLDSFKLVAEAKAYYLEVIAGVTEHFG